MSMGSRVVVLGATVAENLFVGRKRPRTRWGGLDWETMRGEARKRLIRTRAASATPTLATT